jgi:hypothetical protein
MDLVFRDLSEDIKKKCLKAKSKKEHQAKVASKVPKIEIDSRIDQRLIKEPYVFSNDCAALFFFHDYVLLETQQPSNLFDLLPGIYQTSIPGSPLAEVITALGLVCLSNTTASPEPLIPARARYVSALHSINDSIRDPGAASADETLMAVLLLGLYEDNTSTPGSLEQWAKHMNGAQALLDVRGSQQLKTRVGRQLITNLRTSTIANCLLKHTAVPACIMRWSALLEDYETPEEASASTLAQIVASFCELQAFIDIVGGSSESIVPMALQIDTSLEAWASIEVSKRPITHSSSPASSPLSFPFHTTSLSYNSLATATHWNHYRAIRIMLHSLILAQLDPPSPVSTPSYFDTSTPHAPQILLSEILVQTLSHDICASVSFCLNLDPLSPTAHQPSKAAYAKLLLWPLYTAGKSACVPAETAEWVADMFDFIAKVTGVRKGASLAKALRAWPVEGEEGGSPKAHFAEVRQAVMEGDEVPCSKGMYLIC